MSSTFNGHDVEQKTIVGPPPPVTIASARQLSQPVAGAQRIEALDIVRGFALFGVLMLNMLSFSGPVNDYEPWAVSVAWWDRTVELGIRVFGEAAFYSIFSFLFGLGFALQFERAMARAERFSWRFVSRLAALGLFGLIHGFLIWDGDILLQYSVAGFFLLLFAKVTSHAAPRWALGFGAFTLVLITALSTVSLLLGIDASTDAEIASDVTFFSESGFWDIASQRLGDWIEHLLITAVAVPWFLSLFLVGLWALRSGKLANWRNEREFLISVLKISVPIAIVAKGGLAVSILVGAAGFSGTIGTVLSVFIGGPALGATYVCCLLLALQKVGDGAHLLRHLAPVGRMALTNYLMQSTIAVLVFYGYGLGWYGRFGIATTFGFTIALFSLQIVFSRLWLDRFSFGPMEWLWRAMTYGKRPSSKAGVVTPQ